MQQTGVSTSATLVSPQGLPVAYCPDTTMVIQPTVTTTTAQVQEAHSTTNHITGQTVSVVQLQENDVAIESDKRAIYRHPLFPLMALLFEKCEQATQTPDVPSSDSFDVDIQAFVHHQEQDRKPFFSEDPDLDNLMVKAIQVLRIHLLELEKVTELCKDFCNRYISCLKGKLQSENLLRGTEIPGMETDSLGSDIMTSPGSTGSNGNSGVQSQNSTQPVVAALGQGQIVSGGTVYQMVQTPQGIVAQPIQVQSQGQNSTQSPVIHGSTPLSQIGVSTHTTPQQNAVSTPTTPMLSPPANFGSDDEDDGSGKKKPKRGVLPKQATQVMKSWLFQHIVHPYPTEDEKRQIAQQTNLSLLQVNNWFINARRRILQPMLDASNPEQVKAKKTKPNQSRPVQRFWPDSIANLQPQLNSQKENSQDEDEIDNQEPDQSSNSVRSPSIKEENLDDVGSNSSQAQDNQRLILPSASLSSENPLLGDVTDSQQFPLISGSIPANMISQVQQGVAMVTQQMGVVQNGQDENLDESENSSL